MCVCGVCVCVCVICVCVSVVGGTLRVSKCMNKYHSSLLLDEDSLHVKVQPSQLHTC